LSAGDPEHGSATACRRRRATCRHLYNSARFPRVTASDNVRLQHRLVAEKFFVKRLALVTG
jgi:homoserine acetyltransferase